MTKCITILFALLLILGSCKKSDPITPGPTPETFVKAKAGSIYTYDKYETDSTGTKLSGVIQTVVDRVLITDLTYHGKNSVLMVADSGSSGLDTTYIAYETNNDVSLEMMLTDLGLSPLWVKIPVASGSAVISSTSATTEISPGVMAVVSDSVTVSFVSSANIIVNGNSIATKKMKMNMHILATTAGVKAYEMTVVSYVYYAPSLGFYVKTELPAIRDLAGGWSNGTTETLVDYILK